MIKNAREKKYLAAKTRISESINYAASRHFRQHCGSLRKSGDLLKLGVLQHKVLEIIGLGHELGG